MTKAEATKQVRGFFKAHEVDSPGLNERGLGGASLDAGDLYFEYLPALGALKCSALIYRFRGLPNPPVLAAFKEETAVTDTGGGRFEFQPANRGMYLARTYEAPVEEQELARQLRTLLEASHVWKSEVAERVADRAYGHA